MGTTASTTSTTPRVQHRVPKNRRSTKAQFVDLPGLEDRAIPMPRRRTGALNEYSFFFDASRRVNEALAQKFLTLINMPESAWHRDKTRHAAAYVCWNFLLAWSWRQACRRRVRILVAHSRDRYRERWQTNPSRPAFDPLVRVLGYARRAGWAICEKAESGQQERVTSYALDGRKDLAVALGLTGAQVDVIDDITDGIVRMNDVNGMPSRPRADDMTVEMSQHLLDTINAELRRHRIEIRIDGKCRVVGPRDLTYSRVFCRDEIAKGGRFYAPIEGTPKEERKSIWIDGKPTTELDFASIHIRIAYAIERADCPEDPYDVALPGLPKKHWRTVAKSALLIAINAADKYKAAGALRARLKKARIRAHSMKRCLDYIDRVVMANLPIARHLLSDVGVELQRSDSDIAGEVLLHFAQHGKACIGVHDSFVVAQEDEAELRQVMEREFRRIVGAECGIKRVEKN